MIKMNTLTPSYGVAHSKKTDTKTCDIFFNALKTTLATAMHTTNTPTSNLTDEENTRLINSYRSDEKTLISYGYPNGFTYKLEYSAKSTNENPIITVQGITEHGRYFERDIFINEINPYNATIMEMDALEAHYHLYNENGLSSLPPELPTPPGLNTTYNFVSILKKEASLMKGAGYSIIKNK